MSIDFKKNIRRKDMPKNFSEETANTICRIDENLHVIGVLYLEKNTPLMCTVQDNMGQLLATKVPDFTDLVRSAIAEIDVLDELIAYRIETRSTELLVAPAEQFAACVLHKNKSKRY